VWEPIAFRIHELTTSAVWSRDLSSDTGGPRAVGSEAAEEASNTDWTNPHDPDAKVVKIRERDGQFSVDGKWVAYQSNEAGHFEIYLRPFPGPGDRIQVSSSGGQHVRWAKDGSELFHVAADQRLTSVRVTFRANGKVV
jgi:hypothetical protein